MQVQLDAWDDCSQPPSSPPGGGRVCNERGVTTCLARRAGRLVDHGSDSL